MHILNGFNAEMCLGLTVTLITAPHTDKYAIATIKSYPIMGKIFLYLKNKSIKGKKKVLTMVHSLKTLLQLQKTRPCGGLHPLLLPFPPIVFNKSCFISRKVWDLKKKKKNSFVGLPCSTVSYFFRTREKADTQETEKLGSV